MKKRFLTLVFLMVISTTPIHAGQTIQIEQGWIPEAPPVATVMAGYMNITNNGKSAITLTSLTSPVFQHVEIHKTVEENNMARMIKQDTLTLPANKTIEFAPGGLHLMLMQPKQSLTAGDTVPITLIFNDGLKMNAEFIVKKHDSKQSDHHHHHH